MVTADDAPVELARVPSVVTLKQAAVTRSSSTSTLTDNPKHPQSRSGLTVRIGPVYDGARSLSTTNGALEPPRVRAVRESARASRTSIPVAPKIMLDGSNISLRETLTDRAVGPTHGLPTHTHDDSDVSLAVNYLPTKFSGSIVSPVGVRKRRSGKSIDSESVTDEGPSASDESLEKETAIERPPRIQRIRWNKYKWALICMNSLLTLYSVGAVISCVLTWLNIWPQADVVVVGNRLELILSTYAASLTFLTVLIGWSGIMLNNRAFLAVYTFLLWICFAFLVVPGYLTYHRRTFNLDGKINTQWSHELGDMERLRIQNQLKCCGFLSPFVDATFTSTCYARTILPGCKLKYLTFQRATLGRWYRISFGLVPLHLFAILVGLLCSNHINYRFGKGMTPTPYRLSKRSIAVIMNNYTKQLEADYKVENSPPRGVLSRAPSVKSLSPLAEDPEDSPVQGIITRDPSDATLVQQYRNSRRPLSASAPVPSSSR